MKTEILELTVYDWCDFKYRVRQKLEKNFERKIKKFYEYNMQTLFLNEAIIILARHEKKHNQKYYLN